MTRKKKARNQISEATPPPVEPTDRTAVYYLAALMLATVICFYPLLKYFFAQDDFVLMFTAARDGWGAISEYFSQKTGMFRPLTKAAYFGLMYRAFGLDAAPYHVASVVLHLANVGLFYVLMRRLRVSMAAALTVTTLFALSISFFHVIAWISCIQQLLGECFMLAALVWGIDYMRHGSDRARWGSLAAYILALLSIEQTFGVPIFLFLYAWLAPGAPNKGVKPNEALNKLAPHVTVMAVYLVFMAFWKTVPQTGSYAFALGPNVAINFLTYIGWSLHFGVVLPSRMATGAVPWHVSHFLVLLLVVYHVVRKRWREVAFGLACVVFTLFPALFLSNHTFYLHTYIPAFGILYLIALLADDVFALSWLRSGRVRVAALALVLLTMSLVSFVMVRKNEQYKMFGLIDSQRSFVLRRAFIARNIYNCVVAGRSPEGEVQKVYMVYGRKEGKDEAKWNNKNVVAATGRGSLIKLIYNDPEIPVEFKVAGDAIAWDDQFISDIFFFDDYGGCVSVEKSGDK